MAREPKNSVMGREPKNSMTGREPESKHEMQRKQPCPRPRPRPRTMGRKKIEVGKQQDDEKGSDATNPNRDEEATSLCHLVALRNFVSQNFSLMPLARIDFNEFALLRSILVLGICQRSTSLMIKELGQWMPRMPESSDSSPFIADQFPSIFLVTTQYSSCLPKVHHGQWFGDQCCRYEVSLTLAKS